MAIFPCSRGMDCIQAISHTQVYFRCIAPHYCYYQQFSFNTLNFNTFIPQVQLFSTGVPTGFSDQGPVATNPQFSTKICILFIFITSFLHACYPSINLSVYCFACPQLSHKISRMLFLWHPST